MRVAEAAELALSLSRTVATRTSLLRAHRRRFFPFGRAHGRRRRSWVLSWPVPRVVSDVYMCTNARAPSSRDPSSPLYIHLGSLNHLCTAFPCRRLPPPRSAVSISLSPWSERTYRYRARASSSLCSVQGERDAVKVQPSFLKRARSIVRSFSKGSRGIACPKPFISVSAEVRPSRSLIEKERTRETLRSLDKVSRQRNEEAAASGKLVDVSISCLRRAQRRWSLERQDRELIKRQSWITRGGVNNT